MSCVGTLRRTGRAIAGLVMLACLGTVGCATFGSGGDAPSVPAPKPMDQARIEKVFSREVDAIEGPSGALRTVVDGVEVYLLTDPANDRMQLIASVAAADQVDPRVFNILLQANHFLTVDARYSVSNGVIYAVYLHPISSLTEDELVSGLEQVIALSNNFGTTFSSGKIELGLPRGGRR